MWHKISTLAVLFGLAVMVLGVGVEDGGVRFRVITFGLFVLSLGEAALYAERKEQEDEEN